jgi:lysine 2,3-aminomutase
MAQWSSGSEPRGAVTMDERWQAEEARAVGSVEELWSLLGRPGEPPEALRRAAERFSVRVTRYYLELALSCGPDDALIRMILPDPRELRLLPGESPDPIGDADPRRGTRPAPGLTHRHPDRVLLFPTARCSVHCRFCFRRVWLRENEGAGPAPGLDAALEYVAAHPEIEEAILTGGDPLTLGDEPLLALLGRLRRIPHLRTLRIHTRVPAVNPFRLTPALARGLARFQPLWLVTHFAHPAELTGPAREGLARLADAGIPLLNQCVLLRGVNDSEQTLRRLVRELITCRVQPYYLHHLDPAPGISHFRVPPAAGLALLAEIQGTVPGYALPRYVRELPGARGKVPIIRDPREPAPLHGHEAPLPRGALPDSLPDSPSSPP